MTNPPPDRTGYTVITQGSTQPGKTLSYAVIREADGVGLGAFFDSSPGGDVDQAIALDRVRPLP
jgi:hypothetical protein